MLGVHCALPFSCHVAHESSGRSFISVKTKWTIVFTLSSFLRKKYVHLVPRAGLQVAPGHVPQGATPGGCWGGTELGLYTTCSRALAVTHFKHICHLAVQRVPPTTIASVPTHLQRILTTLLVVQVIDIEWLVNGLQRCEQLRFQERMMRSMPCVGVK